MHDGQNLFDPATAFVRGQHWRLGEMADMLIAEGRVAAAHHRRREPHRHRAGLRSTRRRRTRGSAAGWARPTAACSPRSSSRSSTPAIAPLPRPAAHRPRRLVARRAVDAVPRAAARRRVRPAGGAVAVGVVGPPRDSALRRQGAGPGRDTRIWLDMGTRRGPGRRSPMRGGCATRWSRPAGARTYDLALRRVRRRHAQRGGVGRPRRRRAEFLFPPTSAVALLSVGRATRRGICATWHDIAHR